MTPEQLTVYTEEVLIQTELALWNADRFQRIIDEPGTRQSRVAWMHLQAFLSHFGMVSKLLYAPTGNRMAKTRAEELRSSLGLDESSPLNNRDARNAIEHLDERLDHWLDTENNAIVEMVFEDREGFEYLFSGGRNIVRRAFIISESIFVTQDRTGPKEMPLQPLNDALNALQITCKGKLGSDNTYNIIQPN